MDTKLKNIKSKYSDYIIYGLILILSSSIFLSVMEIRNNYRFFSEKSLYLGGELNSEIESYAAKAVDYSLFYKSSDYAKDKENITENDIEICKDEIRVKIESETSEKINSLYNDSSFKYMSDEQIEKKIEEVSKEVEDKYNFTDDEFEQYVLERKIKSAIERIKSSPYYHVYMPNFSAEKVTALAKQYKAKYNIQALFMDYIKIPASQGNSLQQIKEYQALGFFTSTLKDIAGTLKIPVYSAVQENRNDEKGTEKGAGNVAGSDRILQLATKLMFLYAKTDEQIARDTTLLGNRHLKIAYQRNGESDCPPINLQFDNQVVTIREV